nr:putative ring finger protein p8b7.23 [Quercus suber]
MASEEAMRDQRGAWGAAIMPSTRRGVSPAQAMEVIWCILTSCRYIHANYRFIVEPQGDYHQQTEDADIHLDWNNVLQIIASSKTQASSCPICLGEPTAPRMAKCGHIFCLPCLIRYMHSEDSDARSAERRARWKKCPICWDSIYVTETRPVRWYVGQENEPPREGQDVVLRLVKRKAGSTLAMPRESVDTVSKGESIPWYFAAEVMDYSRVMKGSEGYMLQQYDEAIAAIHQLEKEDELMFGEDAEWTGRATRMLREAKEKVKGIGNPPEQPKKPEQVESSREERPPIQFNDSDDGVPDFYLHKHSDISTVAPTANTDHDAGADQQRTGDTPVADASHVPRTLHEMRQRQYEKPQPNEYLFYQALLHYYLSPLDIRILKTAFGSYHSFPSSILPRVERVSSGHIVDDELRKRVKYLAHLPYGCEVGFLECDWTDTVSPEVLHEFRPMLERRRKRHDEKEAREEKERVRIEKAEERELAAVRRKRPSIPNDAFSAEMLPPLGGVAASSVGSVSVDGVPDSSPPWSHRPTPGFASLASPSTSPTAHRTVWGTAAVTPASPDLHALLPRDDAFREDDGWLQGWETDLLDHRQMEALSIASPALASSSTLAAGGAAGAGGGAGGGGGGGGKKGKKNKKITLMSTTARRGA